MSEYTNQNLIQNGDKTQPIREKLNNIITYINNLNDLDALLTIGSYSSISDEIYAISDVVDLLSASYSVVNSELTELRNELDILSVSYSIVEQDIEVLYGSVSYIIDSGDYVKNVVDGATYSNKVNYIISLSQVQYDALVVKDSNTLYVII